MGATTLILMTLRVMTLSVMAHDIITFSITTFSIQHINNYTTLDIATLSIYCRCAVCLLYCGSYLFCYAACRYAERSYAERRKHLVKNAYF